MKMRVDHDQALARSRARIEKRLRRLLSRTGSSATLATVKALIFEEDGRHPFSRYVVEMTKLFGADDDDALALIQDAWNFFPHRRLANRCPADLFLESSPGLTPDDLRADRS
jgi:hypothetical protein